MPVTEKNQKESGAGFDVMKFRKLVNLLQSNRAGEADTARLKALEMCAASGLMLPEGLALAYGGERDTAELEVMNEQLLERLAQTEGELRRTNEATEALIDDYERKLAERGHGETQEHRGLREFLRDSWNLPQLRVALLLIFALCAFKAGLESQWVGVLAGLIGIWLFLLWCAAEIDMSGWLLLIIKAAIVLAAVVDIPTADVGAPSMVFVAALVVATKLLNNIGKRLMRISWIASVVEIFR